MSAPLGVLHVVGSFALGGAERMAVELANQAGGAGVRSAILATRAGGPLRREVGEGVPVLSLERVGRWDPRCFSRFRAFVREQGIAIIHSHGPGPLQYVAAALLPGGMGCRHIFHNHRARETASQPDPDLGTRLAFRARLSAVIGVDRLACAWTHLRMGWPEDRTFLLRNGIDTERFRRAPPADLLREFGIAREAFVIAMIANFRDQKDHRNALRALALAPSRERMRLLLLGDGRECNLGYYADVRRAVEALGLEGQVVFAGARSDVPSILAAADVGMLSSSRESGPLALLEYMAAGLPFAATRVGEIALELPEDQVGFLVAPRDPEALSAALERLARMDGDTRREMGSRGRALARAQYDQSRTAERLAAIYRQVMQW